MNDLTGQEIPVRHGQPGIPSEPSFFAAPYQTEIRQALQLPIIALPTRVRCDRGSLAANLRLRSERCRSNVIVTTEPKDRETNDC